MLSFAAALARPNTFGSASRSTAHRTATRACASQPPPSPPPSPSPSPAHFEIITEKRIFQRYQTVYDRTVRYPNGQTVSYDVIGNARSDFKSVFVFPFDTATRTATLLHEYSPGRNREGASFVAGMFESAKHASLEHAARAELSEEARLRGGSLHRLAAPVAADKYSLNDFNFFLGLDCVPDQRPLERDAEEWISVRGGVPLRDVRALIAAGELNTPNCLLAMLALERLRAMGFE